MKKRRATDFGFFNLRVSIAFLVCGAAACSMLSGGLLAVLRPEVPAKVSERTLSFTRRVAYQRAIEEVYWRHRIWPKERPDPKPPLDAVMSQSQLEKKVTDYLRDSQALEDYWQEPPTAEQLQAEMNRMARNTKAPEVLRELFEALGNDPFVVAECLARPVLSERLKPVESRKAPLDSWRAGRENRMPKLTVTKSTNYRLPLIASPSRSCTDDTWTATNTTNAPDGRSDHTAIWTGSEIIVWGGLAVSGHLNTGGRYNPSTDSWTATSTTNAPIGREGHTAVWTGSEMIVWGGESCYFNCIYFNDGGRYNPSTDTWVATSATGAPDGRSRHTAVWTGSAMIVWGGYDGTSYFNTGGRYNPSADSWTATSITNAPEPRLNHRAVWTDSEMIVWGGHDGFSVFNTGARYNPSTDSWTATSTTNVPTGRYLHTAVWTSSEMIVWSGSGPGVSNTGGRYNPSTDSWTATSTTDAPSARYNHTAVWTGSEMIVWGGAGYVNTGGRYNPGTDSWTATSTTSAPDGRERHTAVWTGNEMIVWGGYDHFYLNTGGRYCATGPSPTPTPTPTCIPGGAKLYNIGGFTLGGLTNTTRIYDIPSNTWTTGVPLPAMLSDHATAYYNGKIYVAGGYNGSGAVNTLYIYDIATNTWTTGASMPQALYLPGFGIINGKLYIASGNNGSTELTTLYIYNIASNTWTIGAAVPTPVTGPGSAVYQGHLCLFGGGFPTPHAITEVYDPVANTWSICGNLNVARLWFYGGNIDNTSIVAPGGDTTPDVPSTVNEQGACTWTVRGLLPYPARGAFAVSDGIYVYIGGGYDGSMVHADLLRYDPVANTYTPLAPSPDSHYLSQAVIVNVPCVTPTPTATAKPTATPTPTPTPTATTRPTPTARPNVTPRSRPTPPPRP